MVFVCLDAPPPPSDVDQRSWSIWSGGYDSSSKGQGINRWFDKHQFIVDSNADSGFNGERECTFLAVKGIKGIKIRHY